MTIEYKDSKRIVGLSYTAGTLTTSGFAQTWSKSPSNSQFEVSSGRINFLDNTSSTGDRTWLDLQSIIGSAVSTTKWILRFKFNFSTLTSGSYYYEFDAGLSDTTVNNATNQNFIGVRVLPSGFNNLWRPRTTDGTSYPRGGSSADISQSFSTGTNYYVEIKRTSASNWSISLSTTDAYDGDIQDDSYTDAGSATGLRYFKFGDAVTNTGTGFTMQGVCDVLEFYNDTNTVAIESGDVKPTNVQDNSIMVEKDTANRYWFDSDNTGGLKQTTFADDYDRTRISNEYAIDMTAKPDGSKLFVTFENQKILEYTLSTAGDLTTISETGDYTHSLTNPKAITFKPDGTRMFLGHYAQELIRTYSLSVAWDIDSTITEIGSGVDLDVNAHGIRFSEDGLFMFISDDSGNLKRHNLATAYTVRKSVDTTWNPTEFTNIQGFDFSDSGKKLFCVGNGAVIYEYSLATAWDISNVTFVTSKTVTPTNMNGLVLSNNSSRLFVVEQGTGQGSSGGIDTITQFNIASQVWNAGTKTPAEIGDLKAHYDATVGVTASSNSVSSWADQSGNGKTLSSVSNPTRVEAGQNGKDYIDFNSSKSMRASGLSEDAPRPFTMVAVINPRNTSDQTIIRWGQSPYLALYQYPVNTYYISGGTDVGLSDSTLDGSWNVFFMDFKSNADGGTLQINLDTANAASGDIGNNGTSGSGGNSQPSTLHVGINGTNNNWYGNCRYAEIIIFDRVITAYEKEQLFNHLKTKWGL